MDFHTNLPWFLCAAQP